MKRAPLLWLGGVNLALLLVLAWLWFTPDGRLRNVRWEPPAPVKPALGSAAPLQRWSTDYSRFVVTLERPLFNETRRPPPKPQAQPVDTLSTVTIVGIWGSGAQAGVIAREGQQTDAEQSVKAMVLDRGATANAKPELEIFADDVKCAHGATVGELDRNQLFYAAARGLDPVAARALLLEGFVAGLWDEIGGDDHGIAELAREALRKAAA